MSGGAGAPARSPERAAARDATTPVESVFRRHWTLRDRVLVAVGAAAIWGVLRLVYATLRVRCSDPHGVLAAHARGARVVWATWHDGIALLPLMVVRVHRMFRPRVALSWHRDAEIAAQVVRRFGVAVTRGSATRGWLGAVRGLLAAHARGEDLVVIPDGPRGPRHEAKPGVAQLARATGLPVVAIGLAATPVRCLPTWDRLQLPVPFGRVALVVSAPIPSQSPEGGLAAVQHALDDTACAARTLLERQSA